MEEAFDSAVIFFSDATHEGGEKQASAMPRDPQAANAVKETP